jgi:hypothetical protein
MTPIPPPAAAAAQSEATSTDIMNSIKEYTTNGAGTTARELSIKDIPEEQLLLLLGAAILVDSLYGDGSIGADDKGDQNVTEACENLHVLVEGFWGRYSKLAVVDPEVANRLAPRDPQYLLRG